MSFRAVQLDSGACPLTAPQARWGILAIVYDNNFPGQRSFHCEEQPIFKFFLLPVLLLLDPQHQRKVAVVLHATIEHDTIPLLFHLLEFRCFVPQQECDVLPSEVRVHKPAKTCTLKEYLQQGTVRGLALFINSAILRAPVTDEPMHPTRALHF